MRSWFGEHFDAVAAAWLIGLVFAWSIYFAALSASKPSDWSGPLVGGVDWNAYSMQHSGTQGGPTVSIP